MDSSPSPSCPIKKGLSAEDVAPSQVVSEATSSPNSNTSLDKRKRKKKVQQLGARGCDYAETIYFVCDKGHVIRRDIRCHSRFVRECPYCGQLWRKKTVKRYKEIVSRMESPKHVVLTLKTLKKGGKHKLDELSGLVQRCRFYVRRRGYKIRNYVSCIEPPNHVHCIWDCSYIPQHGLSEIWKTITGDSFIVFIEQVDKQRWRKAVKYITKYITKISDRGIGMNGMHVIGSWGNPLSKKMRMVCKECGSFFHPLWDLDYSVEKYVGFECIEVDRG